MTSDLVLVTGASGFIAKHIVLELLRHGFRVRGTLRSVERAEEVRAVVRGNGLDPDRCEFALADLHAESDWGAAVLGCRHVLHTASPFPLRRSKRHPDIVRTATEGTEFALKAAARANVDRVVVTSSIAAMLYGHRSDPSRIYGEADFTDLESRAVSAYARSKTQAELTAWRIARETGLTLSTINPGLVFGPVLDDRFGSSAKIVAMIMKGWLPVVPDLTFASVDVRDVAKAHARALTVGETGRRFLLAAPDAPSFLEISRILGEAFPERRNRLPTFRVPDWVVRSAAALSPDMAMMAEALGPPKTLNTEPARHVLGIDPIPAQQAVIDLGASLLRHRCV